jgi:hypothetical protein
MRITSCACRLGGASCRWLSQRKSNLPASTDRECYATHACLPTCCVPCRYPGSTPAEEHRTSADAYLARLQVPWLPEALSRVTLPDPRLQRAFHPGGPNLAPLYVRPDLLRLDRQAVPYPAFHWPVAVAAAAAAGGQGPWVPGAGPVPFPGVDPALVAAAGSATDGAVAASTSADRGAALNRFAGMTDAVSHPRAWQGLAAARQAAVLDLADALSARSAAADAAQQRAGAAVAAANARLAENAAAGVVEEEDAAPSEGGPRSPTQVLADAATLPVDRAFQNAGVGVDLRSLPAELQAECAGAVNLPLCLHQHAAARWLKHQRAKVADEAPFALPGANAARVAGQTDAALTAPVPDLRAGERDRLVTLPRTGAVRVDPAIEGSAPAAAAATASSRRQLRG